jgi:hypothetical protein
MNEQTNKEKFADNSSGATVGATEFVYARVTSTEFVLCR